MPEQLQWLLPPVESPPEWFIQAVSQYCPNSSGRYAAQLLWQRGICDQYSLDSFVNPQACQELASPFEFGAEMYQAVERLQQARDRCEKVAIWGDFDADGITSTAVLWDGLGQFFSQNTHLVYYIPNRITESHGLNCQGIELLAKQGSQLIVTCDTGSTNIAEIEYAKQLGIDTIVTDHHTLPLERPPVVAIINPRYLPQDHPLFHLSGVAVAYKLVEALYQKTDNPQQPLEDLLDLVAIGLIADLVQLSGDCRYLAQLGIAKMQQDFKQPASQRRRPGVGRLLEWCQKSGDRPTDISFGLGPRINAVSRIQGDASFCVELLTSRDLQRVEQLAQDTELANSRRKSLQKDVAQQVTAKLQQLDLSTTSVIVLADPQWSAGVLGLVAGQVAQETGRPTILLSTEGASTEHTTLARGSARSVNQIDLYQLVKDQAHLLHRFGGHPYAAGLSLPTENISLFAEAINQKLRQSLGGAMTTPTIQADLMCTVQALGKELFWELKLLEPCGMGNPVPKLLIQNCWFENAWHRNQQDGQGKKVQYIKTEFDLRDDSTQAKFPGVWWGHYKDELPPTRCDCIVEIDYNSFKKRYEIRVVALRTAENASAQTTDTTNLDLLDWRNLPSEIDTNLEEALIVQDCPRSWDNLRTWFKRSLAEKKQLVLAWKKPQFILPNQIWLSLLGIAKYISRTGQTVSRFQLCQKLEISDQTLKQGFQALTSIGFTISSVDRSFIVHWQPQAKISEDECLQVIEKFLITVQEEQFQQQYFSTVPLSTIQAMIRGSSL
ncbi:single-stranded-DNA-specific exonuclease RecJ [Gloeocapsopsis sp. IPPAS B-1203]|uniref:single-stranded-DNA-specific exonuclease RecJ n=1 Tax=Gloeocapsopsis sp. IPPAS B-1203 TaxID=2049454 RepID=UPI000C183750|nr:single-stranded-DNA-specific exonuclease RecJ [Gloeocapsopsis sp. IPPAS B-1203]PIG95393.1 single-stranded-DNA-specific exonuclease RecJ [Gloeocapsopsis sp. IPPAS B-1203]